MYYNLIPNNNHLLGYSEIAQNEQCSSSAIRNSVRPIVLQLVRLENPQKILFLNIMNKLDI